MNIRQPYSRAQIEDNIQKAIVALQLKEFKSIRLAAEYFEVPKSTLADRMSGKKTRAVAHEIEQALSNAEENTLARWITRLITTGFPATPMLIKEMAEEVRIRRVQVVSSQTTIRTNPTPIGHEWIYRFLKRHPNFKGVYSRQLESARYKEATPIKVSAWFNAFKARIEERKYKLCNIYNMDETGFAVGETQSTRIIVDSALKSNWKVTAGKQEWITVLECIDADDLSILRSSPPDGTELRHANLVFNTSMESSDSPTSPTRRYAKRMSRLVESQNAELSILRKEVKEYKEILETRKKRTKGKRIKLQGEFVFSTEEVLKIVREAELKPTEKRPRGRPRKRPIEEVEEEIEEEEVKNDSSDSELELEECVARRTRSNRVE
ncbi:hypothetical protein V493_08507 [Pseudogymnoascus sp. VKM F-4281 (FW-2241)]|nr:hypothetical protein V493_08507 [Pseudogymnoascus sp. VKM F-4281 (FW-2241)]